MVDRWEAELIAAPWLHQDKPTGAAVAYEVEEFDLGYVIGLVLPLGSAEDVGSARVVIDRQTGELTYWSSVPFEDVVEQYRAFRQRTPAHPLTWDPVARAHHDRLRAPYPDNVTHLRLADGRLRIGHSMKGDGTPNLHPLVREVLDRLPTDYRDRGADRCSEVAALSDLFHGEDATRAAAGEPPLSREMVRTQLLRGADLVTYRIREPGDPHGGQPAPPCVSCHALLRESGFALQPPEADVR